MFRFPTRSIVQLLLDHQGPLERMLHKRWRQERGRPTMRESRRKKISQFQLKFRETLTIDFIL